MTCEPAADYKRAVLRANEKAGELGESHITTEHLLYGLICDEETTAARVLGYLGVNRNDILAELAAQKPVADNSQGQERRFTPRSRRIIDLACDEARDMGDTHIGTEHLLLALVREGEGLGGMILRALGTSTLKQKSGLTPADVREAVRKVR